MAIYYDQVAEVAEELKRRFDFATRVRFFIGTLAQASVFCASVVAILLVVITVTNDWLGRVSWLPSLPWWLIVAGAAGLASLIGVARVGPDPKEQFWWHTLQAEDELLKEIESDTDAILEVAE